MSHYVIYHYCSSEEKKEIESSGILRLYRHSLNKDKDELCKGLELIKREIGGDPLGKFLENLGRGYSYYLGCFTDKKDSAYHRENHGACCLTFDYVKLSDSAWNKYGASSKGDYVLKCSYCEKQNMDIVKSKIKEINNTSDHFLKAYLEQKFIEEILPCIKSNSSSDEQEYRIFIPDSKVCSSDSGSSYSECQTATCLIRRRDRDRFYVELLCKDALYG